MLECAFRQLFILSMGVLLVSCAPFAPNSEKAGECNELNSRMIFNGSTSNIRQSEIQSASDQLVQRSWDNQCEQKRY